LAAAKKAITFMSQTRIIQWQWTTELCQYRDINYWYSTEYINLNLCGVGFVNKVVA